METNASAESLTTGIERIFGPGSPLRPPRTEAPCLRQSDLTTITSRNAPKEEVSINAQLLTRAGFVNRLMAGVYSFLPLGIRVLAKIETIIREEMTAVGSQEVLLPALQPREIWDATGRWDTVEVLFRLKGSGQRDLTLGPTHEEVVTPLMGQFIRSHRDLPMSVFQIQTKFRNEPRAKSGILRGREFRMKDMYSFHPSQADLDEYYLKAQTAYERVFERCGIGDSTYRTFASGGMFSKYSHEYQTLTEHGEDTIFLTPNGKDAVNKEVLDEYITEHAQQGRSLQREDFVEKKAIEVGNIFCLGSRFSDAFGLSYQDSAGVAHPVVMGCYGIGSTRLMGTVVEVMHDANGMKWPAEIAPYRLHLLSLFPGATPSKEAEDLYRSFSEAGIEVLYDDRDAGAGEKLKDADLIGIPFRLVIGPRSLAKGVVEFGVRSTGVTEQVPIADLPGLIAAVG